MRRTRGTPPPTPAARRYLDRLGEVYEVLQGRHTLETPLGPMEVAGRAEAGGETRTILEVHPESVGEEYCARLAFLDQHGLGSDYLVFLTPYGRLSDTPLRALSSPGPRRRFHLRMLVAERAGRMDGVDEIHEVMSEALAQPVRCTPDGVYTLDDAMSVLARPYRDLPTLTSAARAVALFLGASGRNTLDRRFRLSGGRVPVFEYETDFGPLRLEAGAAAMEALLQPGESNILSDVIRALGSMARDPYEYPEGFAARWVRWAPDEKPRLSEEAAEAVRLGREHRQQAIDEGRLPGPELLQVWGCPGCRRLHCEFSDQEDFRPRHLEEALVRLRQSVDRGRQGLYCRCGTVLTFRAIHYSAYCHYFAWPGLDLHLEALRRADGRLVEGWGRIEAGGTFESLTGQATPAALDSDLGRRFSLASDWVRLMEAAEVSGQPEGGEAGRLAWLAALPPGRTDETSLRLQALLEGRDWGTTVVLHLSGLSRMRAFVEGPTFLEWAPRFAGRLEDGTFGSAAVVDWPGYVDEVVTALRRDGLEPAFDPDLPGRITLEELKSWGSLDLLQVLAVGLHEGLYPEEIAVRAAALARASLQEVNRVLHEVQRLAPPGSRVDIAPDVHLLRVGLPGEDPVDIDVDGLVSRWSRDGADLERQIRYLLSPERTRLDQCRCGEPSHLAVKLRGPDWLSRHPDLVRAPGDGVTRVYVRECPHHLLFLRNSDLERMGLALPDLERMLRRDLDRTGTRLSAFQAPEGQPFGAAFVGPEAASLAAHGSLVHGACQAAGLKPPARVDLLSEDLNMLLVTAHPAPAEVVEPLLERARARLEAVVGRGGSLELRTTTNLDPPRGRFRVDMR